MAGSLVKTQRPTRNIVIGMTMPMMMKRDTENGSGSSGAPAGYVWGSTIDTTFQAT